MIGVGGRAIVADDDPAVRAVIRSVLSADGWQLREAEDGERALELFRSIGADLILSDLQMPRMDGIELLRQVRAVDDTVAFVILTGAGSVENAVEALRLQADDYIIKPFHVDEVCLAADRAVNYRRLMRDNRLHQQQLEEQVAKQARQLETLLVDAIRSLAIAIDARDDYTGGHVERVSRYAAATGLELGIGREDRRALWVGALLHDVGKIGVGDAILKKPGPLTVEEYADMKRHPEIGAAIMDGSSFLRPGLPGVLHHQERWDGRGYPAGLRGEAISLHGRIIAVVDSYDAMVSNRPYRGGRTREEALAEIRACSGTDFDPVVVEAFFRACDRGFPLDPEMPVLPERAEASSCDGRE